MIDVYEVNLTKEKLAAIPLNERRLLLLLGHATNEINLLHKLILMSGYTDENAEIKFANDIQSGQIFALIRTLAGKLHEAWELFTKRFYGDAQIKEKYISTLKLNAEIATALEALGKHFGERSPLTTIRNAFSFHYWDEDDLIEKSFQAVPAENAWCFYLSDTTGNCFYFASEMVVAAGVMSAMKVAPDSSECYLNRSSRALNELFSLIILVSRQIMVLFEQCITEIVSENFAHAEMKEPISIAGAPSLMKVKIPFFVEVT